MKLQRWLDLLATLLARNAPATFAELARDVPAYHPGESADTVKRMFERDKLELRELGIPIISLGDDGDVETAYQLKRKDFYLPYLAIMSERGTSAPQKVDRYGYRSLATLTFDADELAAIRDAAQRVMQVGDPTLTHDAKHALQKLAFDLPLGATEDPSAELSIASHAARADPKMLATLGDALFRRKRTTFRYTSMAANEEADRDVEPYGLFFLNGHWYLAARDVEKDGMRNFRVNRMSAVKVNSTRPLTADYAVPESFVLREHARSRQAWEIGDGERFEALVEFRSDNGAAMAAAALGRADAENPAYRRYDVRRGEWFVRWLLAFGGDAVPVAPQSLVTEYSALAARTRALYA